MKRAFIITCSIVGVCLLATLGVLAYLLYGAAVFEQPIACGAEGPQFAVRCVNDTPYLMVNDLPYPTDVDAHSHPTQSLDGRWYFRTDPQEQGDVQEWFRQTQPDTSWQAIDIPATVNTAESAYRDYRGVTWFFLEFQARDDIPATFPLARLGFDGVLLRSRVWLNGTLLGPREGGYTPFFFDVSATLRPGQRNYLVVRTDNRLIEDSLPPQLSPQHNPGWADYGGIYRSVHLDWLPQQHIFKVQVRPRLDPGRAAFDLTAVVYRHREEDRGPGPLSIALDSPDGKGLRRQTVYPSAVNSEVALYTTSIPVKRPRLWRPADPALYTLTLQLQNAVQSHTVTVQTGLREIRVVGPSLQLNGTPVFLRGISKHEDDPQLGATQTAATITRDLQFVRDMHANYIRLSHYPHAVQELRTARDMGILVSEEIPFYQTGIGFGSWLLEGQALWDFPFRQFGMHHLYNPSLMQRTQQQLIEMIERDINNPAVIMWSIANETFTFTEEAGQWHGWLADVARYIDPTRPVTMAEVTVNVPEVDALRSGAAHMDVISVNMYFGWYYGAAADADAHVRALHERFPDRPILISEFGAGAAYGRHESDGPWRQGERVFLDRTYSEEYQAAVIEEYLSMAQRHPYVVGVSPWVFADFLCPWFANNPVPGYNTKGLLSKDRQPKAAYHTAARIYEEMSSP